MFYARYIVLQVGKKEVPFLISDADNHGWERPRGNSLPHREKVLGAGFVTWEEGDSSSVQCFGAGLLSLDSSRRTSRSVESRGDADTELVRALLAKPINYVVLRLDAVDYVAFAGGKDDHEAMVLKYQVYPSRCAVSAGQVDFGHTSKQPMSCYGEGLFNGRPPLSRPSRGVVDAEFMKKNFVKFKDSPEPPRSYRIL